MLNIKHTWKSINFDVYEMLFSSVYYKME